MNHTELPNTELPSPTPTPWIDPVLKELWDVKRAINVEAKFDVKEIARMANSYRLESILRPGV
jgi:hypothetical protein